MAVVPEKVARQLKRLYQGQVCVVHGPNCRKATWHHIDGVDSNHTVTNIVPLCWNMNSGELASHLKFSDAASVEISTAASAWFQSGEGLRAYACDATHVKWVSEVSVRYVLMKRVLGNVPEIEITETEYRAYKAARNVLLNGFAIEEKYEILISNYLEFEKGLVDAATVSMVRDRIDYSDFFAFRLLLNIRLVNLMTSARLYVDQVGQHVPEGMTTPTANDTVKNLFSTEYDAHFEYRFMEALRNHVQHRGLPVYSGSLPSRWTPDPRSPNAMLVFSVELSANRTQFAEDGTFKKGVLAEMPEQVDLKAATRRYIECLSKVHTAVRNLVSKSMDESRQLLEQAHEKYRQIYKESLVGLSALQLDGFRSVEEIPLLLDWDDVRREMVKRNRQLINLSKRCVSSEINAT